MIIIVADKNIFPLEYALQLSIDLVKSKSITSGQAIDTCSLINDKIIIIIVVIIVVIIV